MLLGNLPPGMNGPWVTKSVPLFPAGELRRCEGFPHFE